MSSALPCGSSLAWTSALVGGVAVHDDDLAASMVLLFVLLIFLVIGLLRTYQGRSFLDILIIFTPTILFVTSLVVWSGLRAHLSNLTHHSSSLVSDQSGLLELVAANGLVSCSPMLLSETTFQVFGLLSKRVVVAGRKWVRYTAYTARMMNLVALIMVVVGTCDYAFYMTAWLDQKKLAAVLTNGSVGLCSTTMLARDLTLLPLMADGLELVALFVLTVLTVCLHLRYRLAPGVVFHVISIQACLAFHFAWKCVRDWSAFQVYVDGLWSHAIDAFAMDTDDLAGLASRIRVGAEAPTLFYPLGIVPLVLAMILIYALNLASYTHPPTTATQAQDHLTTRFHLFLDPTSPRIEVLPTSKPGGATAGDAAKKGAGAAQAGGKSKGKGSEAKGEMYVVKRGWLGGWSVQPAPKEGGSWAAKAKTRMKQSVQSWLLGWSSDAKAASLRV